MLGEQSYNSNRVVEDYDPESPRPSGMSFQNQTGHGMNHTGSSSLGPSSVLPGSDAGIRGFGAPPPPPPPTMSLPGSLLGGPGGSRIPGPGLSSQGSVAPPMWAPSKVPTLTKPPLASQDHASLVSRTSSIQSDGWRRSLDTSSASEVPPPPVDLPSSQFGQPPTSHEFQPFQQVPPVQDSQKMFQSLDGGIGGIPETENLSEDVRANSDHLSTWDQQKETIGSTKKPPPAIARESPLKALYAKGAQNYDRSKRKLNLNIALESNMANRQVAIDSQPPSTAPAEITSDSNSNVHEQNPPPTFYAMPGSDHTSAQSFQQSTQHAPGMEIGSADENPRLFTPETSNVVSDQEGHGRYVQENKNAPNLTETRAPTSRKQKARRSIFFRKRFILLHIIFTNSLLFSPIWTVTHIVAVAGVTQSAFAGYMGMPNHEYLTMLANEFPPDSSAHKYRQAAEETYELFYHASMEAWHTTTDKLVCESGSLLCHWAQSVLHGGIMSAQVSQQLFSRAYRSTPSFAKLTVKKAQSMVISARALVTLRDGYSSSNMKDVFLQKFGNVRVTAGQLAQSCTSFVRCVIKNGLRFDSALSVSEKTFECCNASFKLFLFTNPDVQEKVPEAEKEPPLPEDMGPDESELYFEESVEGNQSWSSPDRYYEEYEKGTDAIPRSISEDDHVPGVGQEENAETTPESSHMEGNEMNEGLMGDSLNPESNTDEVEDTKDYDMDVVPPNVLEDSGFDLAEEDGVSSEANVSREIKDSVENIEEDAVEEILNGSISSSEQDDDLMERIRKFKTGDSGDNMQQDEASLTNKSLNDSEILPPGNLLDEESVALVDESTGNESFVPELTQEYPSDQEYSQELGATNKDAVVHRRMEKAKVLADRRKKREMEKLERVAQQEDGGSPLDVRKTLETPEDNHAESPEALTVEMSFKENFVKFVVDTGQKMRRIASDMTSLFQKNLTHVFTAMLSALVVSSIFIIQGRQGKNANLDDENDNLHELQTPVNAMPFEDEPETAYKSAKSGSKAPASRTRRRAPREESDNTLPVEGKKRSRTPAARRRPSTKSTDEEKSVETRRSSRRSSSRAKR